jgi:hypothetical protein
VEIDYHTTIWMHDAHPEVKSGKLKNIKQNQIKLLQLFPDELVVIVYGDGSRSEIVKFCPGKLELYKFLWDNTCGNNRLILLKHFRRCKLKEEISKITDEDIKTWYTAVLLGSAELV